MNETNRALEKPLPIPPGVTRLRSIVDQKTVELMALVQVLEHEKFGELATVDYPHLSPIETLRRLLTDYRDWIEERHAEYMQNDEYVDEWTRIWRLKRAARKKREANR